MSRHNLTSLIMLLSGKYGDRFYLASSIKARGSIARQVRNSSLFYEVITSFQVMSTIQSVEVGPFSIEFPLPLLDSS